jgi:hypothetical protein
MVESQTDQSLAALRALRDELMERLTRESPDFRTFLALSDAIALFNSRTAANGALESTQRRRGRKTVDSMMVDLPGRARRVVSQREAAELALTEKKLPLTIKELLTEVGTHGAVVGGVRPQATLSSNLSQDPRFILVPFAGRLCWWLADEPVPAQPDGEPDVPSQKQAVPADNARLVDA